MDNNIVDDSWKYWKTTGEDPKTLVLAMLQVAESGDEADKRKALDYLAGRAKGKAKFDWSPYKGPKGGQGWQNEKGDVVYGDKPGSDKPGGEAPTGDKPTSDKASSSHEARQKKIAGVLHGRIDASNHLTPDQKADYKAATSKVISAMPPKALDRLAAHTKKLRYHAGTKQLTETLMAEDAQLRDKMAGKNLVIKGAYDRSSGMLDLDGPSTFEGKPHTTDHFYAHEYGHSVDGPKHEISNSPEWQEAFESDIKGGALSRYATISPAEGLAEFARLCWASGQQDIATRFPKCHAVFKQRGLV